MTARIDIASIRERESATTATTAAADPTSCYPDPCRAVHDAEASALLGTPVALRSVATSLP
jgi:hypothetical protein